MASSEVPASSRTWQYTQVKGGLENNLKLNSIKTPTPSPNQHLVQMIAVALNPVDYKPAEVPIAGRWLVPNPATPGIDFAGRLLIPAAGSAMKTGQLVFGAAGSKPFAAGGLAEVALTEKLTTAALPDGVSPIDAATIPVAGLTAYQSITRYVKKGDRIFINGGSGGTGSFGIQIAKAVGCHVTTTCSTANVELCKSLGADEVIDYRKEDVVKRLASSQHKFHHVVDNVGANLEFYWKCHEYTEPTAAYLMIAGFPTLGHLWDRLKMQFLPGLLGGGRRKISGFFPEPQTEDLVAIVDLMKAGKVKALIDSKFPLEETPEAFKKLKTGRAKGKIVIDINSSL